MLFRTKISLPCAFLTIFILNISTLSSLCFSQKAVNKSVRKEVNGEVFIVRKDAENIRLGLITIYFLTEKQYRIVSDTNNPQYLIAVEYFKDKHKRIHKYLSDALIELSEKEAKRYFIQSFVDSAKQNIINDKTNANGDFKVILRNQKYWVYANAERQLSDGSETYQWFFEYKPDGKPLFLSNDNMK